MMKKIRHLISKSNTDSRPMCMVPLEGVSIDHDGTLGDRKLYMFPESGLTPGERARWRNANEVEGKPMIVVTRCPMIISDFRSDEVCIVKPDREVTEPKFQTFGASTDLIAAKLFGYSASFGERAQLALDGLKARLRAGNDPQRLIDEAYSSLGDSAERVYFISEAMDKRKKA